MIKRLYIFLFCFISITICIISSCDNNNTLGKYIDLSTHQVDILFVSETAGVQQIFAAEDTTFDQVYGLGLNDVNGALDPSWSSDGRKFTYTSVIVSTQTGYPFQLLPPIRVCCRRSYPG